MKDRSPYPLNFAISDNIEPTKYLNEMVAIELREGLSLVNYVMEDLAQKMKGDFSNRLEEYLRRNLKNQGFEFETQEEFFEFCKKRIQRVEFREAEEVHYYLDWKNENERGKMIGITHENRVRINYEDGKVIGTIG